MDTPEALLDAFEHAWQTGLAPELADYVPAGAAGGELVAELVALDLEYRLLAGQACRVEDYFVRYPDLAAQPAQAVNLIAVERLARQRAAGLNAEAYWQRFPQWRTALLDHFRADLPPAPPGPDTVLANRYELGAVLGTGATSTVYRAVDRELNRIVAVKMLTPGVFAERRFIREARSLARLQHPNILAVHDVGTVANRAWLVTELAAGGDLTRLVQAGPMEPAVAAALLQPLAEALQHAHEHGVIHRDLKPSNVLLTAAGQPCLADFGLARTPEASRSTSQPVGTPAYMAPEQLHGQASSASDVYGLGAVLYHLLIGQPPFIGALAEVLRQVAECDPVPPRQRRPSVPRDLDAIVVKCLAKEPHRRYPSAAHLADDLRRFLQRQPVQARPTNWLRRWWRRARRHPRTTLALGTAVCVILVVLLGLAQQAQNAEQHAIQAEQQRQRADAELRQSLVHLRTVAEWSNQTTLRTPALAGERCSLRGQTQTYLQALVARCESEPTLQRVRAEALDLLAFLTAGDGHPQVAAQHLEHAQAVWARLPLTADVAERWAANRLQAGLLAEAAGASASAGAAYTQAETLYAQADPLHRARWRHGRLLAACAHNALLRATGQTQTAATQRTAILAWTTAALVPMGTGPSEEWTLAGCAYLLGNLQIAHGDATAALAQYELAIGWLANLPTDFQPLVERARLWAECCLYAAKLHRTQKRIPTALVHCATGQRLLANGGDERLLALLEDQTGQCLLVVGQKSAAWRWHRSAVERLTRLQQAHPHDALVTKNLSVCRGRLQRLEPGGE
jgi:serine/threonine-protein kinase